MSDLTPSQSRSVRRRWVGRLDDGRPAFLAKKDDTEAMARAVLDKYDPDAVLEGRQLVEWCCHTSDYQYRHGCAEWCDNPSPRIVWVASLDKRETNQ